MIIMNIVMSIVMGVMIVGTVVYFVCSEYSSYKRDKERKRKQAEHDEKMAQYEAAEKDREERKQEAEERALRMNPIVAEILLDDE